MATTTITTATTINGRTTTNIQKIEGSVEEIEKKAKEAGEIISVDIKKNE